MSPLKFLLPCIVYGIAWRISIHHEIIGFLFLLCAGFIVGFAFYYKEFFIGMLVTTFWATLLGFISTIPFIGPLLAAGIVIYFLGKRLKVVLQHLPLMIIGFVYYMLLLYAPHSLHYELIGNSPPGWYDFLLGTSLAAVCTLVLNKMGYPLSKIFVFTIGIPAFIFMFKYSQDHSPFNDYTS